MLYNIARIIVKIILTPLFLPKIYGKDNLPKSDGCIIVGNHTSNIDALILASIYKRPICFMAKIEMFKFKPFAWILKRVGVFPVDRGNADINAMRTALKIVKDGGVLGIFPEGHRTKTGEISKMENGVSMIALKSGAPVIPIYIGAPYKLFKRITIVIGKPLDLSEFAGKRADSRTLDSASEMITGFLTSQRERLIAAKRKLK